MSTRRRDERSYSVVATKDDVGERADVVLARHHPTLSRRIVRQMALGGCLRVDGRRCPPSCRVTQGARLELRWTEEGEPPALSILRVTDRIVYVQKPAGVPTHRLRTDDPPALADAVLAVHPECAAASEDPREAGAVHRLDRETTGVVAFARSRAAWTAARRAFDDGEVEKLYLALTHTRAHAWPPHLPPGCSPTSAPRPDVDLAAVLPAPERSTSTCGIDIALPLGHGDRRDRVTPRIDGKPCRTRIWPLGQGLDETNEMDVWLVLVHLATGFRHQARVHLATVGLPILGDTLYGERPTSAPTLPLLLHAFRIDLGAADEHTGPVGAQLPPAFTKALSESRVTAGPRRASS